MPTARERLLEELAARIDAVERRHPIRVAIDGVDAAGKTVLADDLAPTLARRGRAVIRASIDGFHNPAAIRRRLGSMSPEGYFKDSFDHHGVIESLLQPLGPEGSRLFRRQIFDFRTDQPVDAPLERAEVNAVLLLDGVFLLRSTLREYFDFSVFVSADFDVTLKRAERRDLALFGNVEEIRSRYEQRYIPGQQLYLAGERPEHAASVVIDNNDPDDPRIREAV